MTTIAPSIASIASVGSHTFTVSLTLLEGYAFRVDFDEDDLEPLHTDEPEPLGHGDGPAPSRLLAAAVVNCLASSLLFCLRKSRVDVSALKATVIATLARNERGRQRIDRLDVLLDPSIAPEQRDRLSRCTELFQDYCIVTESVRHGVAVNVTVAAT